MYNPTRRRRRTLAPPALLPLTLLLVSPLQIVASPPTPQPPQQLPKCADVPRILCCLDRVALACPIGCRPFIEHRCPYKVGKLFGAASATPAPQSSPPVRHLVDHDIPVTPPPLQPERGPLQPHIRPIQDREPAASLHGQKLFTPAALPHARLLPWRTSTATPDAATTAAAAAGDEPCGVGWSKPAFKPCVARRDSDERFLRCCRERVPTSCHSVCSYEHREMNAATALIHAVQVDRCDLRHLSSILYCANQSRDNRRCCETLRLAAPELGVGDRCLRMCFIPGDRATIGRVHQSDLVCLSNWNVIMYCARSGLQP